MTIRFFIVGILAVVLSSCVDAILGEKYVSSIKHSKRDLENCYKVKGLFDHYPKSISNKNVIQMQTYVPDHLNYQENTFKAEHYLILSMGDEIQNFYPDKFIYKTSYNDENFIIDQAFRFYTQLDTLKIRNVALSGLYPIPYFENFDFGLGDVEEKYMYEPDIEAISNKYIIPKDLEVFVIKAGKGDYWKLKSDGERPETLEDWKYGYSCGIAISKKSNVAVYWMTIW
jgi:hypothetical protein